MTLSETLRSHLLANNELSDAVEDRIHYERLPQRAGYPCIRFTRISTVRQYDHDGYGGLGEARFQFDCVALDSVEAEEIAGLLVAAVATFNLSLAPTSPATVHTQAPNFVLNQFSDTWPDQNKPLFVEVVDIKVWFQE